MVVRAGDDGRFLVLCFFKFTLSHVWLFVIPRTVARKAPQSTEFPRQEYWSRLPFPPPGDLPDPGVKPTSPASPALAGRFFTTEPPENPYVIESNRNLHGGVSQLYLKNKLIEKEIRFVVNRGRE